MRRLFSLISLVWEIPLAVASWLFFKLMRFLLGRLYSYSLSKMTYEAYDWKVFSEQTLRLPLVLPIIATKGPRWNTHAVIVTAGPIEVRQSLSFRIAAATAAAGSWSIVLYAVPGYQTVATIESFTVPEGEEWHEVRLEPGRYSVNLRYYELSAAAETPEVKADGVPVVPAKGVPADSNDFYRDLPARDGWFYAALHYYVFPMLRLRKWLPASFVRREFLPVGDPATVFRYGFLRAGESLEIESDPRLAQSYNLYLTVYNRSSFPLLSQWIRDPAHRTPEAAADGYYLLRLRRKPGLVEEVRDDWLRIERKPPPPGPAAPDR